MNGNTVMKTKRKMIKDFKAAIGTLDNFIMLFLFFMFSLSSKNVPIADFLAEIIGAKK